jgi:membrane-associated phospholipid phosphatase
VKYLFCVLALALAVPAAAQAPVSPAPDVLSYATAAINPALGVIDAVRSEHRGCRLAKLALSEAVGNGLTLAIKHFAVSPRPCVGCAADGMPSGHTMNSAIGVGAPYVHSNRDGVFGYFPIGLSFTVATGALRVAAHRHTWRQVVTGAGLGLAADWSGSLLRCQE